MLDKLSASVNPSHFIGRLNDKRYENALPAEIELGLVWGVSHLGAFESEPDWFSHKRKKPEGISLYLVPGHHTVFDVKAISDRVMSGNVGMRKISRKMVEASNKIVKRSGRNLDFFFYERRDTQNPKLHRSIFAPPNHEISKSALAKLAAFVTGPPTVGEFIDIIDGELRVRITWKPNVSQLFNYRSSVVNEIFDIDDNHIVSSLRDKESQMSSPNFSGLRGVLLGDIGCASLKQIDGIDPIGRSYSGRQIIQNFLDRPQSRLDFVCVFSPQCERGVLTGSRYFWRVTALVRRGLEIPLDGLEALANSLPAPRFDGWGLEHLHDQNLFGSQSRGWYLGCDMTTNFDSEGGLSVRFSARALHEFLAGRIDAERLRETMLGGTIPFDFQLKQGNTIRGAKILEGGVDEDDDQIELRFGYDPAASPYR